MFIIYLVENLANTGLLFLIKYWLEETDLNKYLRILVLKNLQLYLFIVTLVFFLQEEYTKQTLKYYLTYNSWKFGNTCK